MLSYIIFTLKWKSINLSILMMTAWKKMLRVNDRNAFCVWNFANIKNVKEKNFRFVFLITL